MKQRTIAMAWGLILSVGCSGDDATPPPEGTGGTGVCPPGMCSGGASGGFVASGGSAPATGGVRATSGTGGGAAFIGAGGGPVRIGAGGGPAFGAGGGPAFGTAPGSAQDECDVKIDLRARTSAAGGKFPVLAGTIDLYQCFSFRVAELGDVQALRFDPLIDNPAIVHHYLLYSSLVPQVDGVSSPCVGLHPEAALLAGWAPGHQGARMPEGVGMELGTGNFMLEIHYNNLDESTTDASGVRICATKKPQPQKASVSWLGTEAIVIPPVTNEFAVRSRCAPLITQPITIVSAWPHMHRLGRHMRADIRRAGGSSETLFDKPFDFNNQIGYETPAVLNPGDSITTTCTYENTGVLPVTFGEGTGNEMCYNFVVAYPAYALVAGGLHANACNN